MTPGRVAPHSVTADPAVVAAHSARLYYRYAKAVDDGDLDTLHDMVTEDVGVSRGEHPTAWGVEAFLDVYRSHNALHIPVCRHVVTNVLAEWDGDRVRTNAYFQATMFEPRQTRVIIGSYADDHVLVRGELRISHKRIQVARVLHLPAAVQRFPHVGADTSRGNPEHD